MNFDDIFFNRIDDLGDDLKKLEKSRQNKVKWQKLIDKINGKKDTKGTEKWQQVIDLARAQKKATAAGNTNTKPSPKKRNKVEFKNENEKAIVKADPQIITTPKNIRFHRLQKSKRFRFVSEIGTLCQYIFIINKSQSKK